MHVDISWLKDNLAIGAHVPETAIEWVARSLRVGQVIDLRAEVTIDPVLWTDHGVRFLALPTPDCCPLEPRLLNRGVRRVLSALKRDTRVLVHCQYGIGRSALLGCCVLVAQGHSPSEALSLAKRVRPVVSPSPDQLQALLKFAHRWSAREGLALPSTKWEELAMIAYAGRSTSTSGTRQR